MPCIGLPVSAFHTSTTASTPQGATLALDIAARICTACTGDPPLVLPPRNHYSFMNSGFSAPSRGFIPGSPLFIARWYASRSPTLCSHFTMLGYSSREYGMKSLMVVQHHTVVMSAAVNSSPASHELFASRSSSIFNEVSKPRLTRKTLVGASGIPGSAPRRFASTTNSQKCYEMVLGSKDLKDLRKETWP